MQVSFANSPGAGGSGCAAGLFSSMRRYAPYELVVERCAVDQHRIEPGPPRSGHLIEHLERRSCARLIRAIPFHGA